MAAKAAILKTYFYTPDIRSMWGYIVFAFPFVCSYVRSLVRSSFRHRVKVFALKFIRPHILKTLWWILFIFGMMVDIGLKFLSAPSPPRGWPWGQGHGLRIFIKKSQAQSFCVKVYKTSYFKDPLMDFVRIWHDGRYRSQLYISTIPILGDLGVKVTDLEFSWKSQSVLCLRLYSYNIKTLEEFHLYLTCW